MNKVGNVLSVFLLLLSVSFIFSSCKKKYKCVCVKKGFRVYEEDYTQYDEERAKRYCDDLNEQYEEVLEFGKCKLKYTNL